MPSDSIDNFGSGSLLRHIIPKEPYASKLIYSQKRLWSSIDQMGPLYNLKIMNYSLTSRTWFERTQITNILRVSNCSSPSRLFFSSSLPSPPQYLDHPDSSLQFHFHLGIGNTATLSKRQAPTLHAPAADVENSGYDSVLMHLMLDVETQCFCFIDWIGDDPRFSNQCFRLLVMTCSKLIKNFRLCWWVEEWFTRFGLDKI